LDFSSQIARSGVQGELYHIFRVVPICWIDHEGGRQQIADGGWQIGDGMLAADKE
jgi:hypothetical protein